MSDHEVPEADALEQAQNVEEPATPLPDGPTTIGAEVPEADALEQALEPGDDDDEAR